MSNRTNPYVEVAQILTNLRSEVLVQVVNKLRNKREETKFRTTFNALVYLLINVHKLQERDVIQRIKYIASQVHDAGRELSMLIQEIRISDVNVNRCNLIASILSILFELSRK